MYFALNIIILIKPQSKLENLTKTTTRLKVKNLVKIDYFSEFHSNPSLELINLMDFTINLFHPYLDN